VTGDIPSDPDSVLTHHRVSGSGQDATGSIMEASLCMFLGRID